MGKKEFVAAALDFEYETYIVHIGSIGSIVSPSSSPLKLNIHSFRRPQIFDLIAKKASTKVVTKYLDFADVFSLDLTSELFEHIGILDHAIKLVDG